MEEQKEKKPGGKKPGQKYKSLIVWDLLLNMELPQSGMPDGGFKQC